MHGIFPQHLERERSSTPDEYDVSDLGVLDLDGRDPPELQGTCKSSEEAEPAEVRAV